MHQGLVAHLVDALHAAAGHVGGLGILRLDAGGQGSPFHVPTGEDFSIRSLGRVGEVVPGVVAVVAMGAQPLVVGQVRVVEAGRLHAVVALVWLKPAFGEVNAQRGIGVNAKAL